MRIVGRTLRPSSLQERRVFISLGTDSVRVPRGMNPYVVARSVRRLAMSEPAELVMLRSLVRKTKRTPIFEPTPDIDTPEPICVGA